MGGDEVDADEGIAKLAFLFARELDWNHNIAIRSPERGCNSCELHKQQLPEGFSHSSLRVGGQSPSPAASLCASSNGGIGRLRHSVPHTDTLEVDAKL